VRYLLEGNIGFYGNSGFDYARKFGIRYHDLPEDADDSFFLCKELIPGYLDGAKGVYQTPKGYYVDDMLMSRSLIKDSHRRKS
jgi:predicted N-acetyltransferase YhbS